MATDDRQHQARRLRQCTRSTPLTIGIHNLDSRAFQKKGDWAFSWRNTIQKKPQGMEVSLWQKRALKVDSLLVYLTSTVAFLRTRGGDVTALLW